VSTTPVEDGDEHLDADLAQFALFDRKRGWALAYLVARRVEPGEGSGVGFEQHSEKWCTRTTFRRISAREFARRTGTTHKRIMAYLRGWERAADDGVVPHLWQLAPDCGVELPDEADVPFFGEGGYYRAQEASHLSVERVAAIEREAQAAGIRPGATAYVVAHPRAVTAAILADPGVYQAAKKSLEEYERRQEQADQADRESNRKVVAQQVDGPDEDLDADVLDAVRDASAPSDDRDVAMLVFQEMTAARLGTIRALALLKQHSIEFTEERSEAIMTLCDSTRAALDFVRDLATSHHTGLSDAALQTFLEESGRL
jgi:hypothetical protein